MYSSLSIVKNSRRSGKLIGTHQKLDKASRRIFSKLAPAKTKFPPISDILYFEGARGPDGIKRKSPGIDEPWHFIDPNNPDDAQLVTLILDHQHNLRAALERKDNIRAAFEAAWLAHAITDGLTPAHHYPYDDIVDELMSDKDYKKIFGVQIKGIMRGQNIAQATRNNWLYWGAKGVMTKHIAFEYGAAYTIAATPLKSLAPKIKPTEAKNIDFAKEFYRSLHRVNALNMYDRFIKTGWTTQLAVETRTILMPEIVRAITLAWLSSLPTPNSRTNSK